jgi:transposase InsO family protein
MVHGSARLTVFSRELMCRRVLEEGWTITAAAQSAGVSRQTGSKWVARYRGGGQEGLENRSTRPHRSPRRLAARTKAAIVRARLRLRWGPHRLSWALGIARSTIYAVLRGLGLNRLRRLEPREPVRRYEWPAPGDLLHLDTKKLGRVHPEGSKRFGGPRRSKGLGWSFVHVAVDDHTRMAYAEELPDELGATAAAFLRRAVSFLAGYGIDVRRVLSDNGTCYRSKAFAATAEELGLKLSRTRPYRPQTNGKAEAMVKVLLNGWAYKELYPTGEARIQALRRFLRFYNLHRPHGGLDGARPIDRVRQ